MDNRPTIAEVQEWVLRLYNTCEQTITDEERKEQHKYAIMVQRPQDKKFLVKMFHLGHTATPPRSLPSGPRTALATTKIRMSPVLALMI